VNDLNEDTINETCELLAELIQNKCVNPPGDEIKSAKSIEKFLKGKGISCKIFESAPNRRLLRIKNLSNLARSALIKVFQL